MINHIETALNYIQMAEDTTSPEVERIHPLSHVVDILADRMTDPYRLIDVLPNATLNEVAGKYRNLETILTKFERRVPAGGVRHRFAKEVHGIVESLKLKAQERAKIRAKNPETWNHMVDKMPEEEKAKNPITTASLIGTLVLLDPYSLAGVNIFADPKLAQAKFEQVKMKIERSGAGDRFTPQGVLTDAVWSYMSELGELVAIQDVWIRSHDKARVINEPDKIERAKIYNKVAAGPERKVNPMSRYERAA